MSFMKKLTKGAQKVMGTVGDSVDKGQFSFPLPLRTHDNFKDDFKLTTCRVWVCVWWRCTSNFLLLFHTLTLLFTQKEF